MDQSNSHGQTFIPIMIIVLLVLQSILLIFVLKDIRFIKQLTLLKSVSSQAEEVESLIGTQAPDFGLNDIEGKEISLSQYQGQPVLLVFSSHTCSACQKMYPALREFLSKSNKIEVLLISISSREENLKFKDEYSFIGYKNLHILSATPEIFNKYSISGTPTFVVINKQGTIEKVGHPNTVDQIVELDEIVMH